MKFPCIGACMHIYIYIYIYIYIDAHEYICIIYIYIYIVYYNKYNIINRNIYNII